MNGMDLLRAAVLLVITATATGCGGPGLALVKEGPEGFHGGYAAGEILPTSVKPGDRLVILRVSHANELGFHNALNLSQTAAELKWRVNNPLVLRGERGDTLLLMRFIGTAGEGYLSPRPCTSANSTCYGATPGVAIPLPLPGHVAYAGHLHYRIDDQFPERRSRNLPVITQLTVTDDRAVDIPAALERWPLLKGYTISPAIAAKTLPSFRY